MILIPDRLPSLILLVGFWIPPAAIGWAAAEFFHRSAVRVRAALPYALLTALVLTWSAAWFLFLAQPHAAVHTRLIGGSSVRATESHRRTCSFSECAGLPGSAIACMLAFRMHGRALARRS